MVNDGDLRISDRAEIAEVDRFGSDPKFLQHDGVLWWSLTFALTQPFGEPHGRERGEEAHGREGERYSQISTHEISSNFLCVFLSTWGPFI
jgi:hypothetical protein